MIALKLLETCPFVPVDAFVHLAGLSSRSSAYQQLARLRCARLAAVRRLDPGYLVGERRLGCWMITDEGRRALAAAVGQNPTGRGVGMPPQMPGARGQHFRARVVDRELPLLIASYRLLASLVLERAGPGQAIEVQAWEWPWVREAWSSADGRSLRVTMPAGATLKACDDSSKSDSAGGQLMRILLIPDLGTAPVTQYRRMLRRLVALRTELGFGNGWADAEYEIVIGSPDRDGTGARSKAWLELIDRVVGRPGEQWLRAHLVTWDWVADMVMPMRGPDLEADGLRRTGSRERGGKAIFQWPAPARSRDQLLHLIGRHPFLTVDQLARLLGAAVDRVRRLENELIGEGLLRLVAFEELPRAGTVTRDEFSALGLVEVTNMGRRRVAGWLGLRNVAATRYHGVSGSGRGGAGRRWRLLRALAHTLGANDVFVAFGVAADAVKRAGGDDALVEWRSAAACERRQCKPDGYGCYVRNGIAHGFFLEYDRGTEHARKYAVKFRAYYRYRESGQAARDYVGFPTLLFVTTDPAAERRIAEQAHRAWFTHGIQPLTVLITTTPRIGTDGEGVLGRIWRRAPDVRSLPDADLERWPPQDAAMPRLGRVGAASTRHYVSGPAGSQDLHHRLDFTPDRNASMLHDQASGPSSKEGINRAE